MLSKQAILDKTNNGFEVFKHYLHTSWQLGKNFLNPLYDDKKASCNIYFDRRIHTYKMKDFGNDAFCGDCFDIVGKIKGLDCNNPKDFIEILKMINRDLSLGINEDDDQSFVVPVSFPAKPQKRPEISFMPTLKKAKHYSVLQRNFSAKELSFWGQYGITPEILKAYKV